MTKTFAERCKMFEQCLPDASYRDLLKELHTEMLTKLAEQPAPVVNVQHKPTTYTERFTHAVAVLCGAQPPAEMIAEWFEDVEVNGGHRLQGWVGAQRATPSWVQCIVVLDAAHVLADDPEEGEGHETVKPSEQPAQQGAVAYGVWDTMLGKDNRMMMVRLDKGQDGCTVPLYATPQAQPAQRKSLTLQELEAAWNAQAGHMYQWNALCLDEMVAWAQAHNIKENT